MITIIGSSNVDFVINVPRLPAKGETILGGQFSQVFGGKGANQALAAKRAGGNILFFSKLGKDDYGKDLIDHFKSEGISTEGILWDSDLPTGVAQIWVSDEGDNSIVVAPGANHTLHEQDLEAFRDKITTSQFLLLQLETPLSTIEHVSTWVSERSRLVLNPAPAQSLPDTFLTTVWLLTPNETEAQALTGIDIRSVSDAQQAAQCLQQKGVQHIIITMGAKGCLWHHQGISQHFPAFETTAIDTTAAGDVFNGALVVALDEGLEFPEAIRFASAAAAISVSRFGAQLSIPTRPEIEELLNKSMLVAKT